MLLPSLFIIPGGPETRFFISIYFLLYGYLCYQTDLYSIKSIIIKRPIIVLGSFLATLLMWTAIMGSILASVNGATLLIKNKPWVLEDQINIKKTVITANKIVADQVNNVNVWNEQFNISANQYYYFSFETKAKTPDAKLFYVDLYSGPEYDSGEQDKYIVLKKGDNKYSGVIYTGTNVPNGTVQFRLVTIPNRVIEVDNLVVQQCEMKK